jgi:hypothetical protein
MPGLELKMSDTRNIQLPEPSLAHHSSLIVHAIRDPWGLCNAVRTPQWTAVWRGAGREGWSLPSAEVDAGPGVDLRIGNSRQLKTEIGSALSL